MTYKEPDYETVILLKLGAIEHLLKSFMSRLAEPFQKEWGERVPVFPPGHGSILEWYKGNYSHVDRDEPLYRFNYSAIPLIRDVPSPATGILRILEEAKPDVTVGPSYKIAEITPGVPI